MPDIGSRPPATDGDSRAAAAPATVHDPFRDSLDELLRVSDTLVDQLEVNGEDEAARAADGRDSLRQTLDELDRLNEDEPATRRREVQLAGDKGKDIDHHLDSLFTPPPPMEDVAAPGAQVDVVVELAAPASPPVEYLSSAGENTEEVAPAASAEPASGDAAGRETDVAPMPADASEPAQAAGSRAAAEAPEAPQALAAEVAPDESLFSAAPDMGPLGVFDTSPAETFPGAAVPAGLLAEPARRRTRGAWWTVVAAALGLAAAGGWWMLQDRTSETGPAVHAAGQTTPPPPILPPLRAAEPPADAPLVGRTPASPDPAAVSADADARKIAEVTRIVEAALAAPTPKRTSASVATPAPSAATERAAAIDPPAARTAPGAATPRVPAPPPVKVAKAPAPKPRSAPPVVTVSAATPEPRKPVEAAPEPTPKPAAPELAPVVAQLRQPSMEIRREVLRPTVGTFDGAAAPPRVEPPVEPVAPPPPAAEPQVDGPAFAESVADEPALIASEPPSVLFRREPVVPARAKKRGETGTVVLNVLVDERGRVVRVVVEQGLPGSELEAASIEAVLRWSYRPATENGQPVRAWTTESFVFD